MNSMNPIFFILLFLVVLTTYNCLRQSSTPPSRLIQNLANNSMEIVTEIHKNSNFRDDASTQKVDNRRSWVINEFRKRTSKKEYFGKTKTLFQDDQLENILENVTSLNLSKSRTVGPMYDDEFLYCPDEFSPYHIIDCLDQVTTICYQILDVDFPYECEYFDYAQIMGKFPSWEWFYIAKRDPLYGYYAIKQPGPFYRTLMVTHPDLETSFPSDWLECAIAMQRNFGCDNILLEVRVENCAGVDNVNGTCFYDGFEYNFCHNFMSICEMECSCVEYQNRFSCETEGCNDDNCRTCIEKFESYPLPHITLFRLDFQIYVRINNPLKLAKKNRPELHCFSETKDASSETIWKKYFLHGSKVSDDFVLLMNHGGLYWCEYFTYPNMEVMRSDEFIFLHEDVVSFIVNVTVMLKSFTHSFLPYDIPWRTMDELNFGISVAGIQIEDLFLVRIRPISLSELTADFTYRINLSDRSEEDIVLVYQELQDALSYTDFKVSLTLADRCLKISSDTEPYLTFLTTRMGGVAVAVNTLIVNEDGIPFTRRCFGSYADGVYWTELNLDITFGELSSITEALLLLLSNKDISADERSMNLFKIIHDGQDVVIPYDVYLISQILRQIVSSGDPFDIVTFTNNIDSVMHFPKTILSKSQQFLNATDSILYSFDLALERIANEKSLYPRKIPLHIQSDLILAQIADIKASDVNGVAIYRRNGSYVMKSLKMVSSFDQVDFSNLIFATYLPPSFLNIFDWRFFDDPHLVTAFFLNDALFDPKGHETLAKYAVSFFVLNIPWTPSNDLTIPMYFNVVGENRTCALWLYGIDAQMRSIFGSWERHYDALDGRFCYFEHMTHFTLLVNAPSSEALNTLNRVASIASIIGTCLIIITALVFPKWREQSGIIVLINYSLSVLIQHILLFLFEFNTDTKGVFCKLIGILSHYVILVQFSWMLVISYTQYLRLVVVFGRHLKDFLMTICISVWLVPVFPIGIVVGVSLNDYSCFLTGYGFYFALVLPISLIVLVNLFIFGRIIHSLFCSNVKTPTKRNEFQGVSVCIILFFLMGFTWIFGLMANFLNSIVLSYIFSVFTAFHGLILCIYFILLQPYTRQMWIQKLCKCCFGNVEHKKGSFSDTQTS